ncbi:MAG: fimbrillin family protein [Bacteroidales bacterium]|nr:fimbrillin family protein [Bacteroidales bacterium]
MMKLKYIYIVPALAVLAIACSRTAEPDVAPGVELSFSPAVSSPSVKAIFEGGAFPTDEGSSFSVSAVALTGSTGTGTVLYFFNKAVVYEDSKWCFEADASGIRPRYYWPLAGGMNFYAFSPKSEELLTRKIIVPAIGQNVPEMSGGGIFFKDYTIKHTQGESGEYAPIDDDAQKTQDNLDNAYLDFMSATELYDDVSTRSSSSVPLLFTHNLGQIRFKAVAARDFSKKGQVSNSEKSYDVVNHVDFTVDKIELLNLYCTASYHNVAPHWRDLKAKYNYFPLTRAEGTGTSLEYEEGEIGERTPVEVDIKKAEDEPARMLVIPQSLTDARMKVWFTVKQRTVRDEGEDDEFVVNDYSETFVKTINLASVISEFKLSTCVTFLFRIDLDEINVSVSYSDWKSDGEINPVI